MTPFDIYVFILCLIVFTLLTVLFTYIIGLLVSAELKMIRHGLLDDKIKIEQEKQARKRPVLVLIGKGISVLFCLALCCALLFSIYLNLTENRPANGIPSLQVVFLRFGSMQENPRITR